MVNNVTIQSCHQSAMDLLSPHLTQKSLCAHPPHVTPRLYSNAIFLPTLSTAWNCPSMKTSGEPIPSTLLNPRCEKRC